jgi:hypothetical protein
MLGLLLGAVLLGAAPATNAAKRSITTVKCKEKDSRSSDRDTPAHIEVGCQALVHDPRSRTHMQP